MRTRRLTSVHSRQRLGLTDNVCHTIPHGHSWMETGALESSRGSESDLEEKETRERERGEGERKERER